jgi:hypothetical protein
VSSTYDQYIHHPPHLNLSMKSDGTTVFDGNFVTHQQLGYPFAMGHQFVRKPFKGDNPCRTHNFHEVLAWYGGDPDDRMGCCPVPPTRPNRCSWTSTRRPTARPSPASP